MITGDDLKSTRTFILHMTQQDLADKLGISLRTIGNWEREGVPESREYIITRAIGEELDVWRKTQNHIHEYHEEEWRLNQQPPSEEEKRALQEAQEKHDLEVVRNIIENERLAIRRFSDESLLEEIARRLKGMPGDYHGADSKPGFTQSGLPVKIWDLAAKNPGYSIQDQLEGEEANQP